MAKVRARNMVEVRAALKAIWDSPQREAAIRRFEAFTTKWTISEERAVRCLAEKVEAALTFCDFPKTTDN
ncbi:MAG: transposase [Actinomycetota bacterium]